MKERLQLNSLRDNLSVFQIISFIVIFEFFNNYLQFHFWNTDKLSRNEFNCNLNVRNKLFTVSFLEVLLKIVIMNYYNHIYSFFYE